MRVKVAVLERDAAVAQKNRYAWVAVAALILALLMGLFVAVQPAAASEGKGPPSVDSATLSWIEMGDYYALQQARSLAAETARWQALGAYYEGIRLSVAADTARWVALGNYYEEAIQRSVAADAARWVAKGNFYAGLRGVVVSRIPPTDVSHFYAERMRTQAGRAAALAAVQPSADELARWTAPGDYYRALDAKAALAAVQPSADDLARWTAPGDYYRALGSSSVVVASAGGRDPADLGANPELVYVWQASPESVLAANPELVYSGQASLILAQIAGTAVCSVPTSDSTLGENPELAYSQHFIAEFVAC